MTLINHPFWFSFKGTKAWVHLLLPCLLHQQVQLLLCALLARREAVCLLKMREFPIEFLFKTKGGSLNKTPKMRVQA